MKCIGYMRSASEYGCASMTEFAKQFELRLEHVFSDEPGYFAQFRRMQSLVKLRAADALVLYSYDDLGEDKYMRLENYMFLIRNGVSVYTMNPTQRTLRHNIASAVMRRFGLTSQWDVDYGNTLPDFNGIIRRSMPFGYGTNEYGRAFVKENEAKIVRGIFGDYAAGMTIADIVRRANPLMSDRKLSNMTVKTILRNERYLGRRSKKSYTLPQIVDYDLWLKVHERLEREHPTYARETLDLKGLHMEYMPPMYRGENLKNALNSGAGRPVVDLDLLEKLLTKAFCSLYTDEAAEIYYKEYAVKELEEANSALDGAEDEYLQTVGDFSELLEIVSAGNFAEDLQRRLEYLTDRKNLLGMRLRRIRSEIILFSAGLDQIKAVFKRAREFDTVSMEEKQFISDSFIKTYFVRNGVLCAKIISPTDGGIKKIAFKNVIRNK